MHKTANSLAVTGAQWGDEGKGKIVDYLASRADVVCRFQGGNNAGHTVVVGKETFKMHHLPVGILYPGVICILGHGMVINPKVLVKELESLEERGLDISGLRISARSHVILPFHLALDAAEESYRGDKKIGTTGLGIGPAYADKAYRRGITMADFVVKERFTSWLKEILPLQNRYLQGVFEHDGLEMQEILEEYVPLGEKLSSLVTDTSLLLHDCLQEGKKVIFEGSQGMLLDLDHGTYPYVTSSTTTAGGISPGLGIGLNSVQEIMGVIKAYTTRVGEGPFPTEEKGETGEYLRERGGEYGTTTGRPRRCGWFDGVMAGYSARINGYTCWAVTKLDVLSGLERIKLAVSYRLGEDIIKHFPLSLEVLKSCEPVFQELPGWREDITGVRELDRLPPEARNYLEAMEELTGVPAVIISTGPDRKQTIFTRREII